MDTTYQNNISMKLWPPSKSTRLLLIERLVKNFRAPSIFTRKYGFLSSEEAEVEAKKIEELAFQAAYQHKMNSYSDGSSSIELYAKRSTTLMLEVLTRGPHNVLGSYVLKTTEKMSQGPIFDISGGRREFIDAEEAEEIFEPLKRLGNVCTRICLRNRSFGIDAAYVVRPILSSLRNQLQEVDLSDFIAGRSEDEAIEVMKIFSSALLGCELRYLDLSNNALGEKGIMAFGMLLKSQRNLEELYLRNAGISGEAARAVNELLPSTQNLKVLHFHNSLTGDVGAFPIAEIVARSPLLEDFRCSTARIALQGGAKLSESLHACTHLRKLDLRDNMFGVEGGIHLSQSLVELLNISELYLSYLNLEDEGTDAICIALKKSAPSLKVLELAGNDITAKASATLCSCIAAKQTLVKLNLAENELKNEGTIMVAKALEEGGLAITEVDMSCNSVTIDGARVLVQAVSNKPGFKMLNINSNYISHDGVNELKDKLKHSLTVLGPLNENHPNGFLRKLKI